MSSIIRRRRGLMGVSVMGGLPEIGLNTQSSDSSPHSVTALLIAPGARLRVALYRESGLVPRRYPAVSRRSGEGLFATHSSRLRRNVRASALRSVICRSHGGRPARAVDPKPTRSFEL